jgi:hypothetical protein
MEESEINDELYWLKAGENSDEMESKYGKMYSDVLNEQDDLIATAIKHLQMKSFYPTVINITTWINRKGISISKSTVQQRLNENDCFEIVNEIIDKSNYDRLIQIWNFDCEYENSEWKYGIVRK